MNEEDLIRKLAERARMETPPRVDVADSVMAALRAAAPDSPAKVDPLAWVAAASAAAAIAVLVAALRVGESWTDALAANLIDLPWWLL
jgi:hypothetical protein